MRRFFLQMLLFAGLTFVGILGFSQSLPFLPAQESVIPMSVGMRWLHFGMLGALVVALISLVIWGVSFIGQSYRGQAGLSRRWVAVPCVFTVLALGVVFHTISQMHKSSEGAIAIRLTGYHWPDRYDYFIYRLQDKGAASYLALNQPLTVPKNKPVEMFISSKDVNRSWSMTIWAKEHNAWPGFYHMSAFTSTVLGKSRSLCTKNCALDLGAMPVYISTLPFSEYTQWVRHHTISSTYDAKRLPVATLSHRQLIEEGRQVYEQNCMSCHGANGMGVNRSVPALNSKALSKDDEIRWVSSSYPGSPMPGFESRLDEEAIAAVISYTRQKWRSAKKDKPLDSDVQPVSVRKIQSYI